MRKQAWIVLFVIVLIANVIAGLSNSRLIDYISKPLIVLSVAGYFLFQVGNIVSPLKKWILLALFFSWAGDILLMFQQNQSIYFLLGLSSFLLAHIFYIVFFHRIRVIEGIRPNVWFVVFVVVYYVGLIAFLSPYLGAMKLPGRIYGVVISFMLMLALHMSFLNNKRAGRWMLLGALLFVVSDSILALNKFYQSFEPAGALIMLTYGFAQLFITEGAAHYIKFDRKE